MSDSSDRTATRTSSTTTQGMLLLLFSPTSSSTRNDHNDYDKSLMQSWQFLCPSFTRSPPLHPSVSWTKANELRKSCRMHSECDLIFGLCNLTLWAHVNTSSSSSFSRSNSITPFQYIIQRSKEQLLMSRINHAE